MSEVVEQPTIEDAPPPESATDTPIAAEAVERDVEQDTLDIPDSSADGGKVKYVPLSAVTGAREEIKGLKEQLKAATEGSARAAELEGRIQQLEAHLSQIGPKAQAYDAAVAAQQQPRPSDGPSPEERAELEEIARDLDLYNPDGSPNLDRASRIRAREQRVAERVAQQAVAPVVQHTVSQQSQLMLARAKNTTAPNGVKADPAALEATWARLDPAYTATPEGAKWAWVVALGMSRAMPSQDGAAPAPGRERNTQGQFTKREDIPDPLHTEKAGGRDIEPNVALNERERDYLKQTGMTEKEYLDSAKSAPWLRR